MRGLMTKLGGALGVPSERVRCAGSDVAAGGGGSLKASAFSFCPSSEAKAQGRLQRNHVVIARVYASRWSCARALEEHWCVS